MKRLVPFLFTVCAVCLLWASQCYSQTEQDGLKALKSSAPRIYIDCPGCDMDFIRTEITFVNYVRDPKEAQVYILVTTERTAGGGAEYTIAFIGQQDYEGMDDTLKFVSKASDTEDDIRKGIVQVLKMGLIRYVARTPLADEISISFEQDVEPTVAVDRWNSWVFSIDINTFFDGEKYRDHIRVYGSLSAKRITPELKTSLSLYGSYSEDNCEIAGEVTSTVSKSKSFYGLIVKSFCEHWSAGVSASGYSSTYSNVVLSVSGGPAIEFNLFPYSESTRRELRFLYKVGYRFADYTEETIYDKTSQHLTEERLSATLEVKRRWGSIETILEGSHYFYDFQKNHLELYSNLSLRIVEGLSFRLFGGVSMIHDQLSLPKEEATREEILLERSERETQYSYWGSVGLNYTFGSIYSNVVNPRF